MESVFIAWSGNKNLAELVGAGLKEKGFRPVVGGGGIRGMFVGRQVINEMNRCSHAIILAQKRQSTSTSAKFGDNLMFEWGYLVSKLPEGRVTVYLIDTDVAELPSDLLGVWGDSIERADRSDEEVAKEIVDLYRIEKRSLDKLEIMAHWKDVKTFIAEYATKQSKSDSEMSQYILYSMLSSYYNDEVDEFDAMLGQIDAGSRMLDSIISLVRVMLKAYLRTSNMADPLTKRDYHEIVTSLQRPYENDVEDGEPDLRQWARIIRLEHTQFCNYLMALQQAGNTELYHDKVIRTGTAAIELIEENLAGNPDNEYFAALILSFLYRNLALSFRAMGSEREAIGYFSLSVEQREKFFFRFRDVHSEEDSLCDKFAQEYCLALLEKTEFEQDPNEKRQILMTVSEYLDDWKLESDRKLKLVHMVEEAYARIERALGSQPAEAGEQA
ncbi:MAG: nucleotide-binding protein [Coriobacteriaceae bacterium]|nr:nucleotide-binding protein [Coriobacteriaceae bacterium]